jgi:ribosomal protein S18 acetylase RimI-like enzyme
MIKRRLTHSDVEDITKIHLQAFHDFFLSQLGENFLNLYYKCFLEDINGIGVGIFDDNTRMLGFSVATTQSRGFNKNLFLNNFFPYFIIAIKLIFTRPQALIRLMKNMTKQAYPNLDDGEYAELFSIGVDPEEQGSGIGKMLLEETERIVADKGCQRITLTTDFFDNENVIGFYKKMGYSVFYDFITYPDRKMYKMIKRLN